MKKNCIIIPIYHEIPNLIEKTSLESLSKNLVDFSDYEVYIIYPENLGTAQWKRYIDHDVILRPFNSNYFTSTNTYSELLLTYDFWNTFNEHEFALIYQTDGYCFGGELKKYIDMDYDYIGGPIVAPSARWYNVPAVGNGGVSLRKISTMLEVTDPIGEFMKENESTIAKYNTMNGNMYKIYEDLYFAQLVPMLWDFTKPNFNIAASFSYDMNTDIVYEMNNHVMPLFTHAYDKNIRFWQNYFAKLSNIDIISECEWKNRNGYFKEDVNYQGNLPHVNIAVGAIVCIKNENWRLEKFISKLEKIGFKKVIVIDNNEMSGENPRNAFTSLHENIDIIYIDKFRGKRCTEDNDLISQMYYDAYTHYTNDLTHVMFIDCDEEIHLSLNISSINDLVNRMNVKGYDMMHIPTYDLNCEGNIQNKINRKKVKTIVRTNLQLVKFYRETPVYECKCCDNAFNTVLSTSRTYNDDNNKENVYVTNAVTGTKQEFDEHKMFRGWPDHYYNNRKFECNEDYYYMFNDKQSTIEIG